ncbi:putative cell wall protein [Actinidia eriantha]|uniref:putative cell wall protein n=1 Tax=Actinidia eriantha TaxID=165200 RepID=UPI00258513F0|nr:putative cell wall protein [Actinidia eriantha]
MAYNPKSVLAFLLILNILLAIAGPTLAGRETPKSSEETDTKQPQSFIGRDPSVLIPGFGRYMHTKKCKGFNPFNYNPITGTNGGTGGIGSTGGGSSGSGGAGTSGGAGGIGGSSGSGGGAPHNYVPGGDDTFVPNPGVEVPNP